MKTIKFFTLGCKVNQYETQAMREEFLRRGFSEASKKESASHYLINTCSVTHQADSDSLGFIRKAIRENPRAKIMVAGCLTRLNKDKIKAACVKAELIDKGLYDGKGISYFAGHTRAFVKVQDGCDNFCSFCKVPLVRGRARGRNFNDIIREAERLSQKGFKELVLTGVCLGAYPRLPALLGGLEKVKGIMRIRLSSIEPQDVSRELIRLIAGSSKICPHLHIPLQSGDDAVLKAMKRRYNVSSFLSLVSMIKKEIREVAISTDCIVGFPGESEECFQNTLKAIKGIQPLKTHIFPYSKREGTQAASLGFEVSPKEVRERVARLKAASEEASFAYRKKFVGRRVEVLFEGPSKERAGCWEGYSANYIRVHYPSVKPLKNQMLKLELKHAYL